MGVLLTISQSVPIIISFLYFFSNRFRYILPNLNMFSYEYVNKIFNLGLRFFLIQLTGIVLFQSNSLIIAHTSDYVDVSSFNIAFKYLSVLQLGFVAILNPLWSASTEAYILGDYKWIQDTIRKLNLILYALIFVGICMVFFSPFVYKLWLGDKITPDFLFLFLMLLYFVFYLRGSIYRSFMNGVGKIRLQLIITLIQGFLHIPLAFYLSKLYGIYGVVFVMLLWVVINSIWERLQFKKIITKTSYGIWNL